MNSDFCLMVFYVGAEHEKAYRFSSETSLMEVIEQADKGQPIVTTERGTRIVMRNVLFYYPRIAE